MTNAPEGRTWMIRSRVIDPDIESGRKPRSHPEYSDWFTDADYVDVETPSDVVPNGWWVLERTLVPGYSSHIVGVELNEVHNIRIDSRYGVCTLLYICRKPFGLVVTEDEDFDHTVDPPVLKPDGHKRLVYARQIHKGELTNGSLIRELKLARQAPDPSCKHGNRPRNRDQKRNHIRWARLSDVMSASGLSAEEVLLGFWPYIGWSYDHAGKRHGTLLHFIASTANSTIQNGLPRVLFLDQEEVRRMLSAGTVEDDWIRAGLAKTILRLTALGVQPEVIRSV